ncbi:MAG: peptidoglycan recognition family protein [Bacteroidota bacterium]
MNVVKLLCGLIIVVAFTSCSKYVIQDRPIRFDEERVHLTLEYLSDRYEIEQTTPTIDPKMVVVHYTVIPTLEKTFVAFNNAKLPNWRAKIAGASALNVSSQFVVDQDGTIYRLMPETYMARHVIGLNHCAIGIENVGGTEEVPLTDEQLQSNIWLVKYLKKKYDIQYVIGHSEYTRFEGHALWREVDKGYRTKKSDPGDAFMQRIRDATNDLGLLPLPPEPTQQEKI